MLLAIALAYVLALLLPWDLGPWPAVVALSIALLLAGYGASLRARLWAAPLALAAFLAGLEKPPRHEELEPPAGLARLDAEVVNARHADAQVTATVRVEQGQPIGDGPAFTGTLRVRGLDLPPGTRARFVARVAKPAYFENPSPLGVVRLPLDRTSSATLVGEPRVLEEANLFSRVVYATRDRIRRGLVRTLAPEAAGVARALALGESGAVARDTHASIRDAGLSHVLAVSGLHVGLVGGGLFVLLSALFARLGVFLDPVRVAAATGIAPTLAFSVVAGGSPSAIRAGTMLALALFCRAAGRRPSALATLGGAMLLFALVSPADLTRPAFLLSVLATMSILTMPARAADRWKAVHVSWQLSYRTTLATAPILLLYFRSIPLSGLVSNLILVPLASATLIPFALVQGALGAMGTGELTAPVFEWTTAAFTHAARAFAALGLDFTPPPVTITQLVAVSLAGLVGLARLRAKLKLSIVAMSLGLALGDEARIHLERSWDETLRVTILDVGQGSAAVIELPFGRGVIVADAGTDRPDTGERVVAPFLAARRHRSIDLFVASHAHPDHVGGLDSLHHAMPIREIWAPRASEGAFEQTLDAMREEVEVRLSHASGCETRRYGDVLVEALAPCPGDPLYDHENEDSLVVRVSLGEHAVLLPGDAEHRREAHLVETRAERLRATLLVAPHHGSKTSSTEALVRAVSPEAVFVSAGRMSRFGHPHEGPLRHYRSVGAETWVTARHGGITFTTDGRDYEVRRTRSDAGLEDGRDHREERDEEHDHAERP
jgi:competence protein ComEC